MNDALMPQTFLKHYLPQFLFKHRGFMPVPWLLAVLLLPQASITPLYIVLGALLIVAGESLRIWSVGYAGGVTRTRGQDLGEQLVTAGPYGFVRNPIYIANISLYSGIGVLFGFPLVGFLAAVFFIFQYKLIIQFEESLLLNKFGYAYIQFCLVVPQWIPSLSRQYPPSSHTFSLQKALRSENRTLTSLGVVVLMCVLKTIFTLDF